MCNLKKLKIMNSVGKVKVVIMALALVLVCGTVNAQRWRWHYRPHRVVAVVPRPVVALHVSNHFTQKERLAMAISYLKTREYLTARKYARITGLSKATAEAELDAFVADVDKPITATVRGKKKVYVMKK